ncbi:MAG: hypothetical protein GQ580_06600 [Candidatus Thorarchaeota archaeon]|nr:hypothetical protein [Candidatus Thorarchaeota archaeon]
MREMGDYLGDAVSPTEKTIPRFVLLICIGFILTLTVGGMEAATNAFEGQSQTGGGSPDLLGAPSSDLLLACDRSTPNLREIPFVLESEWGDVYDLDTEQGWIEVTGSYYDYPLPLCITNNTLGPWYLNALTYGHYEPYAGYIEVLQKGDMVGTVYVDWSWVRKGSCCAYDYWSASFYVKEDICLESNQYPDAGPWELTPGLYCETIPGKEVTLHFETSWRGCHCLDQSFTIIHAQITGTFSLSSYFIFT